MPSPSSAPHSRPDPLRPAAVLLDLYDTLVWSEWAALREAMERRLGLDHRALIEAFAATIDGRGTGRYGSEEGDLRAVLEAAGVRPDDEIVAELMGMERQHLAQGIHVYEDVVPTLAALRAASVPTALVSNCSHGTRAVVDRLALEDLMDAVVLSVEVGSMKPDAGIFHEALARVGSPDPRDVVFVDDQQRFLDGAIALGIRGVRIDRRMADTLPAPTGDVVQDLHGLRSLLDLA